MNGPIPIDEDESGLLRQCLEWQEGETSAAAKYDRMRRFAIENGLELELERFDMFIT